MGSRSNAKNTSQRHGNEFEDMMKVSRKFSGAANVHRTGQESFDIDGSCDPEFGLDTSIKAAKGDWIGLADAERFCRINRPWRLLYGPWVQETPRIKRYDVIHEMIIPLGVTRTLLGDLTAETVLEWHNDIASFASGELGAAAARRRRDEIMAEIAGWKGHLRLDFKIDGYEQRRLQLSVRLSVLELLLKDLPDYSARGRAQPLHVIHRDEFHQHILPMRLISTPRHIEKVGGEVDAPAILFDDAPIVVTETPRILLQESCHGEALRRPVPIRREERERQRRGSIDTRQTTLFG